MKRQNKSFIFAAAISQEERDYIDALEKEYEEATTISGN